MTNNLTLKVTGIYSHVLNPVLSWIYRLNEKPFVQNTLSDTVDLL